MKVKNCILVLRHISAISYLCNHLKPGTIHISSKYSASRLKIEHSHLKIPFFVKRYIHYVLANSVQWDILRISMCILLR